MQAIKVKSGIPMTMDVTDNPTFDEWMARVDRFVERHCGLSTSDLQDCDYLSMYEDRVRPIRAANKALRNAGAFRE